MPGISLHQKLNQKIMVKKTIFFSVIAFLISFTGISQTQTEMNEQARKDFKKADDTMTATYKLALAKQDSDGKKLLVEAQRAWIKYKESHCKSASDTYRGGSIQPLIYYSCLTELTDERTEKLKEYLEEN